MNYRHIYHAGNACDVVKHSVLALLVQKMRAKEKPFAALDTHAGCGVYDLADPLALKTDEAKEGVFRVWERKDKISGELQAYANVLRSINAGEGLHAYPGSPRLMRQLLREKDRLALCELHPEDARVLRRVFKDDPQVQVHERDGYGALKAFLPFPEKRGLILIDPPFEQAGEFDNLVEAAKTIHARMPGAVAALWYPVKERPAIWRFHEALLDAGLSELLVAEFMFRNEERADRLNGSGFVFLNAPWNFEAVLSLLFGELHAVLKTEGHKNNIRILESI